MPYLAQKGHNCATAFPYIRVSHGLGAVQAHLHRFQEQPKTFRAYAKGMGKVPVEGHYQFEERAFSSLLVDDSETYQGFLAFPAPLTSVQSSQQSRSIEGTRGRSHSFGQSELAIRTLRRNIHTGACRRVSERQSWQAVSDPVVVQLADDRQTDRTLRPRSGAKSALSSTPSVGQQTIYWRAVRVVLQRGGPAAKASRQSPWATMGRLYAI